MKNNSTEETVYFKYSLVISDNLGLHGIFGLLESFSAKYYCQFCKMPEDVMEKECREDESVRRSVENYDADVQLNDYLRTGIKESGIWHDVHNFHISIINLWILCMTF